MASLLSLLSATSFGVGDFLGGLATRRGGTATSVVFTAHVVGLAAMAGIVGVTQPDAAAADVAWGLASGVAGAVGLVLLYRGLAVGVMSVVAPITALGSAVIPVGFGLVAGERPSGSATLGAGLSLVAIFLVSQSPKSGEISRNHAGGGLVEAIGAGIGFGLFFILLSRSGEQAGMVPLAAARVASVFLLAVVAALTRRRVWAVRESRALAVAAGIFDVAANALFLLATRTGLLTLVAVLSALYPAATIILARVVLGERLTRIQTTGLLVGVAGVTLIATA
jgi:drug/metabolite transporter (DMT)-like permease